MSSPVAGQNAHRELVNCGSVLTVCNEIHESVEEREARVLERQTEIALGVVDSNGAESVLDLERDGEEIGVAVGVARVANQEGTVWFPLQHGFRLSH